MKKKFKLFLIMGVSVISIIVGVILNFNSNSSKEMLTIFNEEYIVKFAMPDDWFLGSDDRFNDPEYSYIKGIVKEEAENYSSAVENASIKISEFLTYDNKEEFINNQLDYKINKANKLLTDGIIKKKMNKREVYYYIDGDYLSMSDPLIGIEAFVFIDDQYYVSITARLKESNGYKVKDVENYVFDIVKSLDITKNDGKIVIEEKESEEICYNNEELEGLKGDSLDYYYNIDTSKFDKDKFDGNINFFGVTVNGKITVNKLKKLGITTDASAYKANSNGFYCDDLPNFSIDTTTDIINSDLFVSDTFDFISVCNYKGSMDLQSDDALVTLGSGWNLTGRNIYPKQFDIPNYSEINIDLVLEKLGNPTYVSGRENNCISTLYGYTVYYYVYDDVAFLYAFYNSQNLDLAGVFYYPIEELDGTAYPDSESSTLEDLKSSHNKYLDSLD